MLLILRYVLLQVVRRSRYAPAAREVTVLLSILCANLVHVLRARSLHTVFLIFFALLSPAELLRVLVADTMHTLGPAHVIPLTKAALISLVRSHHLLNLNALNLQHLLHIALQKNANMGKQHALNMHDSGGSCFYRLSRLPDETHVAF